MSIEESIERSSNAFRNVVWPYLSPYYPGDLWPIEDDSRSMAQFFDQVTGIDHWLIDDRGPRSAYGVASRVQWGPTVWGTFTIRCSRASGNYTEWDKLQKAVRTDSVRPAITVHAYLSPDNKLLACAAVSTDILVRTVWRLQQRVLAARQEKSVAQHLWDDPVRTNHADGTKFLAVDWTEFSDTEIVVVNT
jgi:hypothetical protein